jgi:hypothetical protein
VLLWLHGVGWRPGVLLFGIASFQEAFMLSLRIHVFALFLWGVPGVIGAAAGNAVAARRALQPDDSRLSRPPGA